MRVAFLHPSYPNQFTRIAHRLAQREGWEPLAFVHDAFAESVRRDEPPIAYYGFHDLPDPPSGNYYTQSIEDGLRCGKAVLDALAHVHAADKVDAVVGHASFGTTVYIREVLRIPVVAYVELPGHVPLYCRDEFPAQYPQVLMDVAVRALIHAAVVEADCCLVPSRHAKRLFPEPLQGKVRVQPEGFDLPAMRTDKHGLRKKLGVPDDGPVVGFAGRTLEAVRGFDVFVKVAKAICGARRDVAFVAIGEETTLYGNETAYLGGKSFKRHVLEAEGMDDQAILFKPFLPHDEFVEHLQALDLLLCPLFEGAGNWGLFEAMAAGLPIVASNRCFIPEVIEHEQDGVLCDPEDIPAFARAALDLLAAPERAHAFGLRARRKIAEQFSIERAAAGYAAVIEEAASIGRTPGLDAARKGSTL
ncbi:glycosyltransferase [Candidatus Nitrospira bockiana]